MKERKKLFTIARLSQHFSYYFGLTIVHVWRTVTAASFIDRLVECLGHVTKKKRSEKSIKRISKLFALFSFFFYYKKFIF